MAQFILFQSLGSSGSTTFALNIALGIKKLWPEKKIRLYSEGKYPDVLSFCAHSVEKQKGEYSFAGIEIIHSWEEKSEPSEMLETYDYILIDLDRSAEPARAQFWKERAEICIFVLSFLPSVFYSFSAFKNASDSTKNYYILNKAQGIKDEKAKERALEQGIQVDEVFPFQALPFWKQTFLGLPIVHQKNSRWSKKLFDFIHQEILHA